MPFISPIFVVGAPRSGKKMTADVIERAANVRAFPYEINCLWRYGHRRYPFDTLTPDMMTPRIHRYIRSRFEKEFGGEHQLRIVDRTDHNVVRLEYVRAAFPDCRIIHIIRDGRASVASAINRRKNRVNLGYFWKKAAFVPRHDCLYYGVRYALDIAQARCGKDRYRKLWGIRTPKIEQFNTHTSLAVKCAIQWQECVRRGQQSGEGFSAENYLAVRYEDMVQQPLKISQEIYTFSGLPWNQEIEDWVGTNVRRESLELWKKHLSKEQVREIRPYLEEQMRELKYSWLEEGRASDSIQASDVKKKPLAA